MTDDDLDRALFALPLAEPPRDLHARIMRATVLRPRSPFATWEVWAIGTLLALAVALAYYMLTSVPDAGGQIAAQLDTLGRISGLSSMTTLFWLATGISSVWWISSLTLMPRPRVPVYNKIA